MKFIKHFSFTLLLLFFILPLGAAELKAGINVHNYAGDFLPGVTFSFTQSLNPYFMFDIGIKNEHFAQNFAFGNIIYNTPKSRGYGGFVGLGPLYSFTAQSVSPGAGFVAGVYFPYNITLQFSSGFIMKPENIFSSSQYIAEMKLSFFPGSQKSLITVRYDRQNVAGDRQRTLAFKLGSEAFSPEKTFSLAAQLGTDFVFLTAGLYDLAISGRFGGAYRTKKAGGYGVYLEAYKALMTPSPFKFAVLFEYSIDL